MSDLICTQCDGFLPRKAKVCPHCDASLTGLSSLSAPVKALARATIGAGFAMTLSACYGMGADFRGSDSFCEDPSADLDGDGLCGPADCNEEDPETNAWAFDVPDDGIDQDCDGEDATEEKNAYEYQG